tara:strand:- start:1924 stop:3135 length:1212 start_codon:yes stop_codon:yes gene_type:complete
MIDINKIRKQFPSLSRLVNNNKIIYLDGPAGTQVPQNVIDGVSDYYKTSNANVHGEFITSKETNKIMDSTRTKAASLLGAESASCISIGQNMTSLCFSLTHAFSKTFSAGDEVVITELDHEANRGPWKILEDVGVIIKEVNLLDDGTLDYEDFENKITNKTVLVAMGMSSNAIGTLNDFKRIRNFIKNKKCYFLLDAVHYAPHFSIDVKEFGCDFLLCSAYKFYGPHIGILYSKPSLLDKLDTDNLMVQNQNSPYKIETGTLNHAACNGVSKAIDFISTLGEGNTYRDKLVDAYKKLGAHEYKLASLLYKKLNTMEKITVIGKDFSNKKRTPTVSFTHKHKTPNEICKILGENNICAWAGHFYALKAIQKLKLEKIGGVTRLGICVYNTEEEIRKTIDLISKI